MGENHHRAAGTSSRMMRIKHFGGEIVEVQGGHIVRSTGRKDRHSKVCTAKGPRDRRVRLSAHTAIQFYDVQDRLGYDRPSKAVDWLIKKAKSAIDELAELPPWNPLNTTVPTRKTNDSSIATTANDFHIEMGDNLNNDNNNFNISGFVPPPLVSDEIGTVKSFFPLGASSETSNHSQDLQLSLNHEHPQGHNAESVLFSATTALGGFDGCSAEWEHHHPQHPEEIGRFQRLFAWNTSSAGGASAHTSGGNDGGFLFDTASEQQMAPPDFSQNSQFFSQRGPLQSSNIPFVRAWIDQSIDEQQNHHHQQLAQNNIHHQAALFSGFRVPSRIQGEEEEHDGIANRLSSASSDSHH